MEAKIYPIKMQFDTIYAIRQEGVILIDGGDPGMKENLIRGLAKAYIQPNEVQLILLTHGHWDHVGSTKDIQEFTGSKVLLHRNDMKLLNVTPPPQPPGFKLWGKLVIEVMKLYASNTRIPSFNVDIMAGDEEIDLRNYGIQGKVIHTPGHSWGSVSVLLDDGKAFVGDLAMSMFPLRLKPGLAIFGDDLKEIKKSWHKLLDMGAKVVYPAHGKPFPVEVIKNEINSI